MDSFRYLDVPVTITLDELDKVYRDKAKIVHPDRGGTTVDFQILSKCYEEVKRIISNPMQQFIINRHMQPGGKGENIDVKTWITLEEYFQGTKLTIFFKRNRINYNKSYKCRTCHGKGILYVSGQIGQCKYCKGAGLFDYFETVSSSLQLEVPKFLKHSSLLFEGDGHQCLNGRPGDLVITISVKSDPMYSIKEYDLHYNLNIKLCDALIGYSTLFYHPSGDIIRYSHDKVIKPDTKVVIKDKGLKKNDETYGDLILNINIVFPDAINDKAKELIKIAI